MNNIESKLRKTKLLRLTILLILFLVVVLGFIGYFFKCSLVSCEEQKVAGATITVPDPKVWFLISNKVFYKPDAVRLFTNPSEWNRSLKMVDVFLFDTASANGPVTKAAFLKNYVIPTLSANNIEIGYDTGAATWLSCRNTIAQDVVINFDIDFIKRIKDAGGKITHIRLQSALDKPVPSNLLTNCPDNTYTPTKRIGDMVRYAKAINAVYPGISFSLVDATASHVIKEDNYLSDMINLVAQFRENSLSFEAVILDHSYLIANGGIWGDIFDYTDMVAFQNFVKNTLGVKFGMIPISYDVNNEVASSAVFQADAINYVNRFRLAGGNADIYQIESWLRYPSTFLPETDTTTFPLTNTLLVLGTLIKSSSGTLASPMPTEIPITNQSYFIKGILSQRTDNLILRGWAYNTLNQASDIRVEIYMDGPAGQGKLIALILTDVNRQDVNLVEKISGQHGFVYSIPAVLRDNLSHEFYVYAKINGNNQSRTLLTNSPITVLLKP